MIVRLLVITHKLTGHDFDQLTALAIEGARTGMT
jgi:hypothetical protein